MDRPTCETCVFWERNREGVTGGTCRIRAPVCGGEFNEETMFPPQQSASWCGEHPDFAAWVESRTEDGGKD